MQVPKAPNKPILEEAYVLAKKIVEDAENNSAPTSSLALKAARLAFFLGDTENERRLDAAATALPMSEENLKMAIESAENAKGGKNPFDHPAYYQVSRQKYQKEIADWKSWIHSYASGVYYESRLGDLASSVFDRVRARVDPAIGKLLPEGAKKLSSAYENLRSSNSEDWANAVHTCRRLLKDLADALLPATDDPKLSDERYINRLATFVASRSISETFGKIVGAQLEYLGHRLDAIYDAANKGSHADVDREEADRYVLYTYLFVGDVLSLASA